MYEERHDTLTKQKEHGMEEGDQEQGKNRLGWTTQWEPEMQVGGRTMCLDFTG